MYAPFSAASTDLIQLHPCDLSLSGIDCGPQTMVHRVVDAAVTATHEEVRYWQSDLALHDV